MRQIINPVYKKTYRMPTRVIYGRGELNSLSADEFGNHPRRITILCGEHFKASQKLAMLEDYLKHYRIEVVVYKGIIRSSDPQTIAVLTDFLKENQPDAVVAIGGGAVLDSGKAAAILSKNSRKLKSYLVGSNVIESKGLKFIAVPTTAGTGSEVTPWAAVWDNQSKYSLASPLMFPDLAIVDPSLTDSLPPLVTAETGMDAFTQAVEAFWSRHHNPTSDKYALDATKLILDNLEQAVNNPREVSRDLMAKASLFSGLAFSNTKTTICHAISYPITAHWGVSHGQAVCITLPEILKYSLSALKHQRRLALLSALGVSDAVKAARKVRRLIQVIGLSVRLSQLGIKEKDLDLIVSEGYNPGRMGNAPRIPQPDELKKILTELL